MKLLVISSVLPPFGAAESDYAWQFCARLAGMGHDVTLLTNRRNAIAAPPGVKVRAVMGDWSTRSLPRLLRELKSSGAQGVILLYIGWMYDRHPLATFLPTLTRWILPQARFASVFYNRYGAERKNAAFRHLLVHKFFKALTGERRLIYEYGTLFTESHRVFAFSAQHASVYRTVWPELGERLEVLPALPLLRFSSKTPAEARRAGRARLPIAEHDVLLVFFGYVYPSKGLETLFEAMQHLSPNYKLAIVGGVLDQAVGFASYADGLRAEVNARGLTSRVFWTGSFPFDSESASEMLHAADSIVLPFDEGISLNNSSFAASAWHGRPVVSTTRHDLEAEFRDGENIRLVAPKNPHALALAIRGVAETRELAEKLGAGARRLAEEKLNWEKALSRVVDSLKA